MAVTQGHGNPKWGRDEVLLALDLYLTLGDTIPGPSDNRVVALSEELRKLPIHADAKKNDRFRNAAGVAFKLQNIHQVATGKGLDNFSSTDKAVWEDFGHKPDLVRQLATQIRAQAGDASVAAEAATAEDDEEFSEGRVLTAAHKVRERSPALRRKVLKARRAIGPLVCECCARPPLTADASIAEAEFECHHKLPLSQTNATKTKASDVALLCASCHRLIHRLMQTRRGWASVEDLRAALCQAT
ncbi:HNH endonuclease [Inhella crocodyli]|uniref:HNH endonuclease n=1 Tax=Inhella crocodyli TaxID=2499851 RepID=A0A3S2V1S9_9BURK|nr:HNH endonuclease [Inhella crocodyli]RVT86242.1 HNH endonuclease [Inhella crocodyli]